MDGLVRQTDADKANVPNGCFPGNALEVHNEDLTDNDIREAGKRMKVGKVPSGYDTTMGPCRRRDNGRCMLRKASQPLYKDLCNGYGPKEDEGRNPGIIAKGRSKGGIPRHHNLGLWI
jgi:hypothetical protein